MVSLYLDLDNWLGLYPVLQGMNEDTTTSVAYSIMLRAGEDARKLCENKLAFFKETCPVTPQMASEIKDKMIDWVHSEPFADQCDAINREPEYVRERIETLLG